MPMPVPMLMSVPVPVPVPMKMPILMQQYCLLDGTTLGKEELPALRATTADLGIEQDLLASL